MNSSADEIEARIRAVMDDQWTLPDSAFIRTVQSEHEDPRHRWSRSDFLPEENMNQEEMADVVRSALLDEREKQDVLDRVLRLREQGLSLRNITKRTGIPISTVRRWCLRKGEWGRWKYSPETRATAVEMRQGGASMAEIVRLTHVPLSRVRSWVRDVEVVRPRQDQKAWIIATRVPADLAAQFQKLVTAAGNTVSGHLLDWATRAVQGQITITAQPAGHPCLGNGESRVLTARVPNKYREPVETWLAGFNTRIGIVLRHHIEDCCREGRLL